MTTQMKSACALIVGCAAMVLLLVRTDAQTAKLTAPQTVYGRDFFEVIEGDGKRRHVELHTSSGIGRQVPLYQPPSAGAQCNVGKFGTAGEYLYVCRPIDGAGVIGLWARTKLETVW